MVLNSHGKLQTGETQMKLTKLLTGAGVAALLTAGAAYGQAVQTVTDATFGSADSTSGTYFLDSNIDYSATTLTGALAVLIEGQDASGARTNFAAPFSVLARIDLTGAVFDQSVLDGDLQSCTGTVVDGGAPGDDFVVFEINNLDTCTDDGATTDGDSLAESIVVAGMQALYTGGSVSVTSSLERVSNGANVAGGGSISRRRSV